MISAERIVTCAGQLGGDLSERDLTALQTLCAAAKSAVEGRLCAEVSDADDALVCGAAYLALSWLAQPGPTEFAAGDIRVTNADATKRAALYAALSERLLAPYLRPGDFAFLGVEA